MSGIVKGMKMPNSCTMCWLNTFCGVWNEEPVKHKGFNERLEDCPLTELIQCKDCKHYYEKEWVVGGGSYTTCWYQTIANAQPNDFCSRAERKEE